MDNGFGIRKNIVVSATCTRGQGKTVGRMLNSARQRFSDSILPVLSGRAWLDESKIYEEATSQENLSVEVWVSESARYGIPLNDKEVAIQEAAQVEAGFRELSKQIRSALVAAGYENITVILWTETIEGEPL